MPTFFKCAAAAWICRVWGQLTWLQQYKMISGMPCFFGMNLSYLIETVLELRLTQKPNVMKVNATVVMSPQQGSLSS
jgi:hypothetical protein